MTAGKTRATDDDWVGRLAKQKGWKAAVAGDRGDGASGGWADPAKGFCRPFMFNDGAQKWTYELTDAMLRDMVQGH